MEEENPNVKMAQTLAKEGIFYGLPCNLLLLQVTLLQCTPYSSYSYTPESSGCCQPYVFQLLFLIFVKLVCSHIAPVFYWLVKLLNHKFVAIWFRIQKIQSNFSNRTKNTFQNLQNKAKSLRFLIFRLFPIFQELLKPEVQLKLSVFSALAAVKMRLIGILKNV